MVRFGSLGVGFDLRFGLGRCGYLVQTGESVILEGLSDWICSGAFLIASELRVSREIRYYEK